MTDIDQRIAVLRAAITTADAHRRGLVELYDQIKAGAGATTAFVASDAIDAVEALASSLRYHLNDAEESQREDERIDATMRELGLNPDEFEDDEGEEDEPSPTDPLWPQWIPLQQPIRRHRRERAVLPEGCYDANWGRVHVQPSCRCPR